ILVYYIYIFWLLLVKTNIFRSSDLTFPMIGMLLMVFIHFRDIFRLPKIILGLALIHLVYFLVFEISDFESLKYLLARLTFMIFFSIMLFRSGINDIMNIFKINGIICFVLLLACLFINKTLTPGRYSGVFSNPNELGAMSIYCFTAFSSQIFFNQKKLIIVALLLSFTMVILSGSRISLASLVIVFIFFNKIKISKKIFYFSLLSIPFIGFLTQTVERIIEGDIFGGRLLNWAVTYNSILQKWYFGHGLKSYDGMTEDSIYSSEGAEFGLASAHSGYLTYILMFGVPLGIVLIIIKLYPFLYSMKKNERHNLNPLFNLSRITTGLWLIYGIVEIMFTGVNDLEIILYFSSWITLVHFLNDKKIKKGNIINDYRFNYK
ncbi:O-antigen ligase family protein, partial [Candidatus Marinimicrobia bacterium]|nr:O-antigen ligase family protein [Candidatus Neomarinimicrobiota bacterium]